MPFVTVLTNGIFSHEGIRGHVRPRFSRSYSSLGEGCLQTTLM